jgi:hypothetical protein
MTASLTDAPAVHVHQYVAFLHVAFLHVAGLYGGAVVAERRSDIATSTFDARLASDEFTIAAHPAVVAGSIPRPPVRKYSAMVLLSRRSCLPSRAPIASSRAAADVPAAPGCTKLRGAWFASRWPAGILILLPGPGRNWFGVLDGPNGDDPGKN